HVLGDCDPRVLVFAAEMREPAEAAAAAAERDAITTLSIGPAEAHRDLAVLAGAPIRDWKAPAVAPSDDALIIYTSGTTGHPRDVLPRRTDDVPAAEARARPPAARPVVMAARGLRWGAHARCRSRTDGRDVSERRARADVRADGGRPRRALRHRCAGPRAPGR